jgi:hypothetical protein
MADRPLVALVSRERSTRMALAEAFEGSPRHWRVELDEQPPDGADAVVVGADASAEGVRFDPEHPEAAVEAVRLSLDSPRAHVVVVTSPGGGTGATSVALHLAASLAREASTCFLDLDVGRGVGPRLGLDPGGARTWGDEPGAGSAPAALPPVAGGFRVLLAPPEATPDLAERVARQAASDFHRVVIDVPQARLDRAVLAQADAVVIVMGPSVPAAVRARGLVEKVWRPPRGRNYQPAGTRRGKHARGATARPGQPHRS